MVTIRWCLAGWLATLVWSHAGTVSAGDYSQSSDVCLAVGAIDGLERDERWSLASMCQEAKAPTSDQAALIGGLVARGDWTSTSLVDLLRGGAPFVDLAATSSVDTRAAAERLRTVRDELVQFQGKQVTCKPVKMALSKYFKNRDDGLPTTPPFSEASLESCGVKREALADLVFLTIAVDDPTASLFVAATAGKRTVLQWFTPAQAVLYDTRRVFVVAIPRWSFVSVQADTASAPQRWYSYVSDHRTVWDDPPSSGCLRLSVKLDPHMVLFLDGRALARGESIAHWPINVREGEHSLVALDCKSGPGSCSEYYRESLPRIDASARDNLCRDVKRDLRDRRAVAILAARAAPGCDTALAWRAGEFAREYLKKNAEKFGREYSDLATYASITRTLAELSDDLNPVAGRALGAAPGGDSLEQIASVAKEAWRQGVGELVTFELRCSGDKLDLKGTLISAREVYRRLLGPVEGAELKNLLRIESLEFSGAAHLPSTVESLVDQLFDQRYVRFLEGPEHFYYRQPAIFDSQSYDVYGTRKFEVYPFTSCKWIDFDKIGPPKRGPQVLPPHASYKVVKTSAPNPHVQIRRHRVVARHPGEYMAYASQLDMTAARCIIFDVPLRELWGSVTFAPDIALRTPVTAVVARHLRVLFGRTWYVQRGPWFGYGVHGGYTFTHHSSDGIPAWQDLDVDPSTRAAPLTWGRHALVAGPLIELRSRRADIPVEFRGRLSTAVGVALVDVRKLTEFPEFSGSAQFGTTIVRARPTLDATAELGLSVFAGRVALSPLLVFGAVAINDMFAGRWALSALGGAGLYAGVGLHLGSTR